MKMAKLTPVRRTVLQGAALAAIIASQSAGCGEVRYRDTITADQPVRQGGHSRRHGHRRGRSRVGHQGRLRRASPRRRRAHQYTEFDGVLQVSARCRTPILCAVDAEVHIPDGVPVEVELDRGEVWATGIGNIDVSVGEGEVDIETLVGPLYKWAAAPRAWSRPIPTNFESRLDKVTSRCWFPQKSGTSTSSQPPRASRASRMTRTRLGLWSWLHQLGLSRYAH